MMNQINSESDDSSTDNSSEEFSFAKLRIRAQKREQKNSQNLNPSRPLELKRNASTTSHASHQKKDEEKTTEGAALDSDLSEDENTLEKTDDEKHLSEDEITDDEKISLLPEVAPALPGKNLPKDDNGDDDDDEPASAVDSKSSPRDLIDESSNEESNSTDAHPSDVLDVDLNAGRGANADLNTGANADVIAYSVVKPPPPAIEKEVVVKKSDDHDDGKNRTAVGVASLLTTAGNGKGTYTDIPMPMSTLDDKANFLSTLGGFKLSPTNDTDKFNSISVKRQSGEAGNDNTPAPVKRGSNKSSSVSEIKNESPKIVGTVNLPPSLHHQPTDRNSTEKHNVRFGLVKEGPQKTSLTQPQRSASNSSITSITQEKMCKQRQKLLAMWVLCESQRQTHRLAHEYFRFRSFYYNFLPIGVVTSMIGIISFLSTSEILAEDTKNYLGCAVGILSVVSVALQSLAQESNYRARSELHQNASMGLKKLREEIDFRLVDPSIGADPSMDPEQSKGNETKGSKVKKTVVETYRQVFLQVLDSCNSQVPIAISQPFLLIDSRLALGLSNNEIQVLRKRHGQNWDQILNGNWFNELYVQIANSPGWPFRTPEPEEVINASLLKVVKTFTKGSTLISDGRNLTAVFKNTGRDERFGKSKLYFGETEWTDFNTNSNLLVDTQSGHKWNVKDVEGRLLQSWTIADQPMKQKFEV
jgi:hypothetical protein